MQSTNILLRKSTLNLSRRKDKEKLVASNNNGSAVEVLAAGARRRRAGRAYLALPSAGPPLRSAAHSRWGRTVTAWGRAPPSQRGWPRRPSRARAPLPRGHHCRGTSSRDQEDTLSTGLLLAAQRNIVDPRGGKSLPSPPVISKSWASKDVLHPRPTLAADFAVGTAASAPCAVDDSSLQRGSEGILPTQTSCGTGNALTGFNGH